MYVLLLGALMRRFLSALACCVIGTASEGWSHEFWIAPAKYSNDVEAQVEAYLRIGENFSGAAMFFNPDRFARFDIVNAGSELMVEGRLGDNPALAMTGLGEGLNIIVHETSDQEITYQTWEKFEKFTAKKGFAEVTIKHIDRGLSKEKVKELYRRYAKSLIAVGDGVGADRAVGLKTEIVALANPYTDNLSKMPVRVLLDGEPRKNTQVRVFQKSPEGDVTSNDYQTDEAGEAQFPVLSGFEYLVDAVAMLPLEETDSETEATWWSLWASMTFKVE